jgi:hypothetical protein
MAYRDRNRKGKTDRFDFCIMEVLLSKQGAAEGTASTMRLMTVDNHVETLRFVRNNLDACIGNIVRLNRMEDHEANAVSSKIGLS